MQLLNNIWKRVSNLDKLSYVMVIAFGLSFLMETLWWQFGKTDVITPDAIINLEFGVIGESRLWVRIIEGGISIGLIVLGINRLINHHRICKCLNSIKTHKFN